MATNGRRLSYLIISLGLVVLVVAVYAFRGPILEQWYLSKLDSENEEERKLAAEKLVDMGSSRVVPRLVEVLRRDVEKLPSDGTGLIVSMQWGLGNDHQERIPGGPHDSYPKLNHSLEILVRIGKPAVPYLVDLFKEEAKRFWWLASYALKRIGPPAVPRLSLALRDKSENVRMMAAMTLGLIAELNGGDKSDAAVPFLREALADESQIVRRHVAQALGKFGPSASAAVPDLVTRIEHDEDHHVRFQSARSLGRIGPNAKAAIPVLKELERSGDDQWRKVAAEALEKIQGESARTSR